MNIAEMDDDDDNDRDVTFAVRDLAAESRSLLEDGERDDEQGDRDSVLSLDDTRAKARCLKNVCLTCLSTALVFASYRSLQTLASSLNQIQDVGIPSVACLYAGILVSCFYACAFVKWSGFKWAVVASFGAQALFVAAHFYPQSYLLVPGALLVGLSMGPFWVGQVQYVVTVATSYADYTDTSHPVAISRFVGLFFMFYQSAYIWGHMISSLVFKPLDTDSIIFPYLVNETCGANFCRQPNETIPYAQTPGPTDVYLLLAIYLALCVIGLVVQAVFVDKLRPPADSCVLSESGADSLGALVKIHCNICMVLLIPMMVFIGLQQAMLFAEFTEAFVSCELGVGFVAFSMITFGAVNTLTSFTVGQLEKCTGRALLYIVAVCLDLAMILTMYKWTQTEGTKGDWLLYFIPGVWAMADSVWQTTTTALLANEFGHARDAAFATYQLWTCVGIGLDLTYSFFVCMKIKLDITMALLFVGFFLYLLMELFVRRRMKKPYIDLYAPIVE